MIPSPAFSAPTGRSLLQALLPVRSAFFLRPVSHTLRDVLLGKPGVAAGPAPPALEEVGQILGAEAVGVGES